ncbi:MAG: putative toxin-antitoxin system toxin component, PIN family [ANME-2 cluster archaeon]|nr:putative toxin-antitoxin system toxin component, PIN family [ANME-2 cluster archaeon]MDF1532535.1 putative toxin-antitoxin system toxin component, PIN family [ANME-2 cluster archaeon]
MRLVIDTNIIISSLISNSTRRYILINSNIEFITPEYSLTEISNHSDIIKKKSKLTSKDIQYVMDTLFSRITIYPKDEYSDYYGQAKDIMKDIDPDDTPFLALALKTKVDGIWSEDKGFQQQNIVKIYTTKELIEFI